MMSFHTNISPLYLVFNDYNYHSNILLGTFHSKLEYMKHKHLKGDILLYTVIGGGLLSAAAEGEDHSILQKFKESI